jgi:cardiolipin synthase
MIEETGSAIESAIGGSASPIIVENNRFTPLSGGPERLDALMALIEGARQRLDLYFYIFERDECAVEVRDALVEACRRGVAVTLLVDAFGTATTPEPFFAPLVAVGGRFGRFGRRRSTRYLIRNHQKMAIADREIAMIGGFNICATYFMTEDEPTGWRDFGMLVEGPLALGLSEWFDCLAEWTLSERQSFMKLRRMVREWQPGTGRAIWLMGGPTRHLNIWARRVKADLETGRRLDMAAAYFSPGHGMTRRMTRLARRGAARIVMPSKSDNFATVGAARHLYRRLLRSCVAIFEYAPQKLHAKLLAIDDIGYVGSANFDKRSLFINLEIMLRVDDRAFADAIRRDIDSMAERGRRVDEEALRVMAGPFARILWWFDFLLVGVLDYTVTRRLNFRREMPDDD